jgi:hypothetical protein
MKRVTGCVLSEQHSTLDGDPQPGNSSFSPFKNSSSKLKLQWIHNQPNHEVITITSRVVSPHSSRSRGREVSTIALHHRP